MTLRTENPRNKYKDEQKYLTNCKSFYSCVQCRAHLANHDELVSRQFQGSHSRAYLFNSVINTTTGPAVMRDLITGSHSVADIFCKNCFTMIGWKYEKAYVEAQKYKEGKYIIELSHVLRENRHFEYEKGEKILNRVASEHRERYHSYSQPSFVYKYSCSDIGSNTASNCSSSLHTSIVKNYQQHIHRQQIPTNHLYKFQSYNSTPVTDDLHLSQRHDECVSPSTSALITASRYNIRQISSNNDKDRQFYVEPYDLIKDDNDDDDYDEDEELIFPFYDDLCSNILSQCPRSLSSSHERRIRRSMYSDSKPYDWKQTNSDVTNNDSATSSSLNSTGSSGYSSSSSFKNITPSTHCTDALMTKDMNLVESEKIAHNDATSFYFDDAHNCDSSIESKCCQTAIGIKSEDKNVSHSSVYSLDSEEYFDCFTEQDTSVTASLS